MEIECLQKLDDTAKSLISSFSYPGKPTKLQVYPLSRQGLSGARVYRVIPSPSSEAFVIKVGPKEMIDEEYSNFSKYAANFDWAAEPEPCKTSVHGQSAIKEWSLDKVLGYRSLSDYYEQCDNSKYVKETLDALFKCVDYWYSKGRAEEINIRILFSELYNVERWERDYDVGPTILDDDLNLPLFHPSEIVKNIPNENIKFVTGVRHGDLRFDNVIVNPQATKKAMLIDFMRTGRGKVLEDFVKLEASVKFELLKDDVSKAEFWRLEELLSEQDSYDAAKSQASFLRDKSSVGLAYDTIQFIREKAKPYGERNFDSYLYLMLLQSLKFLSYDWAEKKETDRALIAADLISRRLISKLANRPPYQFTIRAYDVTKDSNPLYETASKLLTGDVRKLTVVQRTPTLLFGQRQKSERDFENALRAIVKRCKRRELDFSYVFDGDKSAESFRNEDEAGKSRVRQNLKEYKAVEKETLHKEGSSFRFECLPKARSVFNPLVLTNDNAAILLAEDKGREERDRKVLVLEIKGSASSLQELHDYVRMFALPRDLQEENEILGLLERDRGLIDQCDFLEREDAMYYLGMQIADSSQRRLVIIQRTPSLILGAEPLRKKEPDKKKKYDRDFIASLRNCLKRVAEEGLEFNYLYSGPLTHQEYSHFVHDEMVPQNDKEELKTSINKALKELKEKYENQYFVERNGLRVPLFRIESIHSKNLAPIAVGDSDFAMMIGQVGRDGNPVVLRLKSKEVADRMYRKILEIIPSASTWEKLALEIGSRQLTDSS